jgi:hypothetical protein
MEQSRWFMREERDWHLWLLVVMAVLGVGLPGFVRSGTPASPGPPAAIGQTRENRPAQEAVPTASSEMSRSFFYPLQATLACEVAPPKLDLAGADIGDWGRTLPGR